MANDLGGTDGVSKADHASGSAPASLLVLTSCAGPGSGCQPLETQVQLAAGVTAPHGVVFDFALKVASFDLNAPDVSLALVGDVAAPWHCSLDYAGGTGSNSANEFLETLTLDGGAQQFHETTIGWPSFTDTCASGDGGTTDAADAGDGRYSDGWVNVEMRIDLVGASPVCAGSPCATVSYDGHNALVGGAASIPITPPASLSSLQIAIGPNYIQAPAQSMAFEYDNVKVEALP